ncbi:hypothetical protein CRENPOLYSF1_170006 [Crenothrix polyspora]|uniref:Uncharacterized protein n=1 Tax=Crenothrix polyspora TaxID=360316 RepID=A0A1R4H428_9GAMM|nr:hypothetical protein CRENPOLYSF1_170006 [Crenothrix polyspora]
MYGTQTELPTKIVGNWYFDALKTSVTDMKTPYFTSQVK